MCINGITFCVACSINSFSLPPKTEDCVLDHLVTTCICDALVHFISGNSCFASAREIIVYALMSLHTGSDMEHEICWQGLRK